MNRPDKPLPHPAEMVLDPGPRGLIEPRLTAAGAVPELNSEAFLAPAKGLAALGAGLAKTGDSLTELAIQKQHADAIIQEHRADTLRIQTENDLNAALREEPDHDKWGGLFTAAADKLRAVYDKTPMSPAVREAATAKLDQWSSSYAGRLQIATARRSFELAGAAIHDKINTAVSNNDLPSATRLAHTGAEAGFWTKEDAGRTIQEARAKVAENQHALFSSQTKAYAQNHPDEFLSKFPHPPAGMPQDEYDRGVFEARKAITTKKRDSSRALLTIAVSSDVKVASELESQARKIPEITPQQIEEAKRAVVTDPVRAAQLEEQSGVNIEKALLMVKSYDAKKDPNLASFNAVQGWIFENVPPRLHTQVLPELDRRVGIDGPFAVRPEQLQAVDKALDAIQAGDHGGFGAFLREKNVEYTEPGSDGSTIVKRRVENVVDPDAFALVIDARARLAASMRDWVQTTHPKTSSEVVTETYRRLPDFTLAASMNVLDGPRPEEKAAPSAGSGTVNSPMPGD